MIGGVWYTASSRTPSTFSGSVSLTARTVTRPLSVRAIVAGATGPGGFSLASEENSLDPFCPVWPAVETEGDIARATIRTNRENNERDFEFFIRLSVSR